MKHFWGVQCLHIVWGRSAVNQGDGSARLRESNHAIVHANHKRKGRDDSPEYTLKDVLRLVWYSMFLFDGDCLRRPQSRCCSLPCYSAISTKASRTRSRALARYAAHHVGCKGIMTCLSSAKWVDCYDGTELPAHLSGAIIIIGILSLTFKKTLWIHRSGTENWEPHGPPLDPPRKHAFSYGFLWF